MSETVEPTTSELGKRIVPVHRPIYDKRMTFHGSVKGGVIVLDEGTSLPEGTRVDVVLVPTPTALGDSSEISPAEHQRIIALIDQIAAMPIEGDVNEEFSGADHDQALYGQG